MRQSAAALDHYARARQLFPSDPEILFASGVLHETIRLDGASGGRRVGHRIEPHHCGGQLGARRAREGRAVLSATRWYIGPTISRRASVTGACSTTWDDTKRRRRNCAARLRTARAISSCISRELFLGRAEEALGHDEAARAAFERASALYPNAQSPRLALSQIARRAGNRAAAQRELQAIAALPDDERRREDPWWLYYDVR